VLDLQHEGSVSERRAAFHAFPASNAQRLIYRVLVVRVFHEFPFDGARGADLAFGGGVKGFCAGLEVTETEFAVTAKRELVEAFYGGRRQYAVCGASSALDAFCRVKLPDSPSCAYVSRFQRLGQTAF